MRWHEAFLRPYMESCSGIVGAAELRVRFPRYVEAYSTWVKSLMSFVAGRSLLDYARNAAVHAEEACRIREMGRAVRKDPACVFRCEASQFKAPRDGVIDASRTMPDLDAPV